MRKTAERHSVEGVFVLLLAGVFAVCVLLVLFTGARTYRALAERDAEAYARRICVQYVAAKVRHAGGPVYVGNFDGGPSENGDTLFLLEKDGGVACCTRIYYYDGAVRELFTEVSGDGRFRREDGVPVTDAKALSFSRDAGTGLLTVRAEDEAGLFSSVRLLPRAGEGAAP